MSFLISKNRMSFQADDKAKSRKLTSSTQEVIGRGTSHVLDEVTYDAADKIHHVTFQFRAYFPALASSDLPSHFSVRINDGPFAEPCTHSLRDYYVLGSAHVSCNEPITKIEFAVSAKADKHFTLPAGSAIHYGAQANESTPTAAAIPAPAPVAPSGPPAIVHGFTAPVNAAIDVDLQGDYRRFPYSFDRSGAAVAHRVVGVYERSVDDGSTISVTVAVLFTSTGWDMWSAFKRTFSGAEYAAAQAVHNAATGHEEYSAGFDFNADPSWLEVSGAFRSYGGFSDGSGSRPGISHNGDIPLLTIEPS